MGTYGVNGRVTCLARLPNGDVVAGGTFTNAGGSANYLARWNGTTWSSLGPSPSAATESLAVLGNGDLFAAGAFQTIGSTVVSGIARWSGTAWTALGGGISLNLSGPRCFTTLPNGDLVVGGDFAVAGTAAARSIARWDGAAWHAFGAGIPLSATYDGVRALAVLGNGDLVAAGQFTTAAGAPGNNIARWDGAQWQPLHIGMNGAVEALAVLPNGNLVAGGQFTHAGGLPCACFARWNGSVWSPMAGGLTPSYTVRALCVLPNGEIVAGGYFTSSGGPSTGVARWNGQAWSAMGTTEGVAALLALPSGDLYAAMNQSSGATNLVRRWNGTSWSQLGTGMGGGPSWTTSAYALAALPNGEIVAGGSFQAISGTPASHLARWNGVAWSPFAASPNGMVLGVTFWRDQLFLAGAFNYVGTTPAQGLTRLATTCPAAATASGAGCPSSGGKNLLAAVTQPWTGSTFVLRGSGLPARSAVWTLTSFGTTSIALASLTPLAAAGCVLHVPADYLQLTTTTTGTATAQTVLPNTVALAGVTLSQQMLPLELDPSNAVIAVSVTNALQVTIGSF